MTLSKFADADKLVSPPHRDPLQVGRPFEFQSPRARHAPSRSPNSGERSKSPSSRLHPSYSLPSFSQIRKFEEEWDELPTPLCAHKHHCFQNAIVRGVFRSFAVGYVFKASLSLGKLLFQGRLFSRAAVGSVLLGDDALRFGQFLGCMAGSYKGIVCFLRWYYRHESVWFHTFAAWISSLALLIDDPSRRGTLALYVLVRSVDELVRLMVSHGSLPKMPHLNLIVFTLTQMPIMYGFIQRPDILDLPYYRWIRTQGGLTESNVSTYRRTDGFRECIPHCHEWECFPEVSHNWITGFFRALKVYAPVHILPVVLFKPQLLLTLASFKKMALTTTKNIAWSSFFISTYTFNMRMTVCLLRNWVRADPWWISATGGFMAGTSMVLEHRKRHSELMLYVVPRAIQAMFHLMPKTAQLILSFPGGTVLMFQFAMAMFMWCVVSDRGHMKHLNELVLRIIFGSKH